jgi:hypothetical protein
MNEDELRQRVATTKIACPKGRVLALLDEAAELQGRAMPQKTKGRQKLRAEAK